MSLYLNVGNANFQKVLNSEIYVDKTDLIAHLNSKIDTEDRFVCVSRPRRFGKSITVKMLCSYYSRDCDSSTQFDSLNVSKTKSYKTYLNKFDTVFLNITDELFKSDNNVELLISSVTQNILQEIKTLYPQIQFNNENNLSDVLLQCYEHTGIPFIVIIDEWDSIMREKKNDTEGLRRYLEWLKLLFKDKSYIALAYMTGILPIKKYGTQSALNMFTEYSMADSFELSDYVGFTEQEVRQLCNDYTKDFSLMKKWYDGYSMGEQSHIYNPNSVVKSILRNKFSSFWSQTESFESLSKYISLNLDGLKDCIVKLISGESVAINTTLFCNDLTSINTKNDVLSLLVHLGYLAIKDESSLQNVSSRERFVCIPNYEIKEEFIGILQDNVTYAGVYNLVNSTYGLLSDIWNGNSVSVAKIFDTAHQEHTSILKYNDENSLACVIALALHLSSDYYTVRRELPSGKGFADLVYIPKVGVDKPALLVELKYDKSADSAIKQIKEKNYLDCFKDYKGKILLVGINYLKASKQHECVIEAIDKA